MCHEINSSKPRELWKYTKEIGEDSELRVSQLNIIRFASLINNHKYMEKLKHSVAIPDSSVSNLPIELRLYQLKDL